MKRKLFVVALSIVIFGLSGCGTDGRVEQSTFRQTFSLASAVEANQQLLLPGPRVSGGSEAGPSEPFTQMSEVMTLPIDAANTAAFLEAVQTNIQQSLVSSGAELLGGGGSASGAPTGDLLEPVHFSYSYRQGEVVGAINVWGVPGAGSSLVLIVSIVEG